MMQRFSWRGVPIHDIRAWAKERGEQMVRYHAERKVPNPYTGQIDTETQDGEMPESFWGGLRMDSGWWYTEVGRENA